MAFIYIQKMKHERAFLLNFFFSSSTSAGRALSEWCVITSSVRHISPTCLQWVQTDVDCELEYWNVAQSSYQQYSFCDNKTTVSRKRKTIMNNFQCSLNITNARHTSTWRNSFAKLFSLEKYKVSWAISHCEMSNVYK